MDDVQGKKETNIVLDTTLTQAKLAWIAWSMVRANQH